MLRLIVRNRRLHIGFACFVVATVSICFMILRSRPAPAASMVLHGGDQVAAVANALRISVMIEGAGVYGAGIFLDQSKGIILTNEHVVQEMHMPKVTAYDGRTATAAVIAIDKVRDLALLSAPDLATNDLAPPRIGQPMNLMPGEEVFAVGMPRKLPFTVSRGIVAYVGRELDGERYLQVDMNINDGNSGGPVVSANGELVGVMSFIYRRAQGLSFALPTTEVAAAFPDRMPVIAQRP